jgi:hypothetical protein
MVDRIGTIAARAGSVDWRIPNRGHQRLFAAGVAAYNLSAPTAKLPPCDSIRARVGRELRPLALLTFAMFRIWRMAKA